MYKNNRINIICNEDINFNRLRYTIEFINNHPLKPLNVHLYLNEKNEKGTPVYYSNDNIEEIIVPVQKVFFSDKKIDFNNLFINEYNENEEKYFSVEVIKKLPYFFNIDNVFGFDIFETIFFHISRIEEYFASDDKKDIHDRMRMEEQLSVKNRLHYIPIVDQLIYGFFKSLGYDIDKKKTVFSLTHDIDIIRKFDGFFKLPKSLLRILLMGKGFYGVISILKTYFKSLKDKRKDPYYTFDLLFREESDFKHKIVFFVAGGKTRQDLFSRSYLKELPEIILFARNKGYDIGLHPSYNAYIDKQMMNEELKLLQKITRNKLLRVRMHFLRLDIQKTFEIIEKSGFEYDSTLGFANDIGFRCGTGFEYYPYNFVEERKWQFKELPMVFMDSALLRICQEEQISLDDKIDKFLSINKKNTHITFNFHNSTFDNSLETATGLQWKYMQLIDLTNI